MLIEEIIGFCDKEFKENSCKYCNSKKHDIERCFGNNCKACLDDIHYHNNIYWDSYNCERLLDYYVCRYSYKYCSEIIYALDYMRDSLDYYPYFKILSLGCGAAPDLMAFDYMNYKRPIVYIGFDKNPLWRKIHYKIQSCCLLKEQIKIVDFENKDVLSGYDLQPISQINIVIFQYLISAFYNRKNGNAILDKWFHDLTDLFIRNKAQDSPMMIIINDVDSINTGRDAFNFLAGAIRNAGMNILREEKLRFKDKNYYYGSKLYQTKENLFDIPDRFRTDYCVAINCESVQYILEVE